MFFIKTNKDIVIQNVKKSNYEKLRKIFLTIRQNEFNWENSDEIKLTDFDNSTEGELIFTASIDDEIVGFISIWEEDNFIHNLFVNSNYRGCGVAKALINYTVNQLGAPLTLKCVIENKNAVNFYLNNGWVILKEEIGVDVPYYLMKYKL